MKDFGFISGTLFELCAAQLGLKDPYLEHGLEMISGVPMLLDFVIRMIPHNKYFTCHSLAFRLVALLLFFLFPWPYNT